MDTEHKALAGFKASPEGEVEAVIATFGTVDHHGDLTLKGFFGEQPTRMVWSHNWDQPVGKGTVTETDEAAIFRGRFFLDTTAGREAHATVKAMDDLQEWSYGFQVLPGGSFQPQDSSEFAGARRVLTPKEDGTAGVIVHEVSPVLIGAGVGTGTLSIKTSIPFADQITEAHAAVGDLLDRARSLADLRGLDGRTIGADRLDQLEVLAKSILILVEGQRPITASLPVNPADLYRTLADTAARLTGAIR